MNWDYLANSYANETNDYDNRHPKQWIVCMDAPTGTGPVELELKKFKNQEDAEEYAQKNKNFYIKEVY